MKDPHQTMQPSGETKSMEAYANNVTEIVFILDASGSMEGLEADTVGGVNAILKEQKSKQNGEISLAVIY